MIESKRLFVLADPSFMNPAATTCFILFMTIVSVHAIPCDNSTNTCQNGGSCINSQCVCALGYTGNLCSIDVCLPSPCENGATCRVLTTGNYTCLCAEGFSGYNCSVSPTETNEYKWLVDAQNKLQSAYDKVMSYGIKTSLPVMAFIVIVVIIAAVIFYRKWQASKNANQSSDMMATAMSAVEHAGMGTMSIADVGYALFTEVCCFITTLVFFCVVVPTLGNLHHHRHHPRSL